MVSNVMAYNPLTLEERIKIKEGIDLGMSYREIGIHCGRGKSTVMRESKRIGGHYSLYDAEKAHKDYEDKLYGKMKRKKSK